MTEAEPDPTPAEVMRKLRDIEGMLNAVMADFGAVLAMKKDMDVVRKFVELQTDVQLRTAGVIRAWKEEQKTPPA